MKNKYKTFLYRIRVEGKLSASWSEWLDGLTIEYTPGGETEITGEVRDQSELFGILIQVRDLGLVLVSVNRIERD
jgi:hypothetical protein